VTLTETCDLRPTANAGDLAHKAKAKTKDLVPETTAVGSGGYAGDLTPPTIYVEGILICIPPPPEKPNT